MDAAKTPDPINDDELLYRRVPVAQNWYDASVTPPLSFNAFKPRKDDATGLSVSRAKYKSMEEAAVGKSAQGYFVAVLKVGDLRRKGIDVIPDPLEDDPGHALLPGLNYSERKTPHVIAWQVQLAEELCSSVEGPFLSQNE